jgi:hypothetical protein
MGMRLYYLLFCYWFRTDLFTRKRENRFWKAVGAVTLTQMWIIIGSFMWAQAYLRAPTAALMAWLLVASCLALLNYLILRRGGWEALERELESYSPRKRRLSLALGAGVSVVAFVFLFITAKVLRAH